MQTTLQDFLSFLPKCLLIALLIFTGLVLISVEVFGADTFQVSIKNAEYDDEEGELKV